MRVAGAFSIYAAASLLLFGRDVLAHPTERVVGDDAADKTLYMWSFEWWPSALRATKNPLDVDVAWAPHGFDFGLGTGGGGLALAAAPLTSLLGPVATYNILILAAPALAATTAFLLAQRLTRSFAPSLVAGYIFGFSTYELGRILGHLPLGFIALVPLVPYLVLRRQDGAISRPVFVGLLTAVLVGQFLIVPQILFTLVLLGALAAAAAAVVLGMATMGRTLVESAVALLAALVLLAPVLIYALVSDAAAPGRSSFSGAADVLNYVVPTPRTWLRPPGASEITERFSAPAEQSAYLGLPFIVLAVLAALRWPQDRPRRVLVVVLIAAVLLSLGTRVKVAGEVVAVGPWSALAPIPVISSALPIRMVMYTALLAGLLVGLALADRRSGARWLLAAAGIAATLPNFQGPSWSSDVSRPEFFAEHCDARYIPEGSTVLVLPYGPSGWSMLWQAESGFRYRIIGGHFALRVTPAEREWRDIYEELIYGSLPPRRLRLFLASHGVDAVVVAPGTRRRSREAIETALSVPPVKILDTLVYRLDVSQTRAGTQLEDPGACIVRRSSADQSGTRRHPAPFRAT